MDSSDAANWQKTLTAVLAIGDNLDISQSGTHIAFISYASSASVAVPFPAADFVPYNPSVVRQLVNSVAPLGESERKVDRALQLANDELFVPRNGSRKASKQVFWADIYSNFSHFGSFCWKLNITNYLI